MRQKAEEAEEGEAEFEMERRGGRGFPLQLLQLAGHRAGCGAERGTSRGSEEERIRILLWVWANIQSDGYNK